MRSEAFSARTPSRRRGWPAQAATLAVCWMVLAGIVIGVGWIITGPLRTSVDPAEDDLARWFVGERSTTRTHMADYVTMLGDTVTVIALGVVIAVAVWLWRREARDVAFVVATVAGTYTLYLVTVTVVPRPRPPVKILDPGLDPTHSFPSGHVGASVAVYGLVVVLVWTYARRVRWWVTPLLLVPPLVALSRLYEGAHHLSDVVTSLVYGPAWLVATAAVLLLGRVPAFAARL